MPSASCTAVEARRYRLRIPGESRGADMDVARAHELGLMVCFDVNELPDRCAAA